MKNSARHEIIRLTLKERSKRLKTVFMDYVTDRFSGRASYQLLKEPK
jgi:hypothetical protein